MVDRGGIGNEIGGPEGVAQRGQARGVSQGEKVRAGGETHTSDVKGRDGAGVDNMGDDGPPPKREGGVQGHWSIIDVVEGVLSCG